MFVIFLSILLYVRHIFVIFASIYHCDNHVRVFTVLCDICLYFSILLYRYKFSRVKYFADLKNLLLIRNFRGYKFLRQ